MQIVSFRAFTCAVLVVVLSVAATSKPALAEISPAPLDDRFGWSRGDADAHHVGWVSFQDELGDGAVFDPIDPVILDTTPDSSTAGSTGQVRETGSGGGFISGSGGIYSFSGSLGFQNKLSGAGLNAGFTRVVAQVRTWGTEFDTNSILLTSDTQVNPIAPSYVEETGRMNLGPPPQGSGTNDQVDTLLLWDLVGSDAEYNIAMSAPGAHMTLKGFHGDVFSRPTPFVTPTSVPEPSGLVAIAVASVGAIASRRRRHRFCPQERSAART